MSAHEVVLLAEEAGQEGAGGNIPAAGDPQPMHVDGDVKFIVAPLA
jgi:hypothetical protein